MTRLIALIAALMMLAVPAMGEAVDEAATFAAEMLPEHTFFDGVLLDTTAMLLVEDAAGTTYLATCAQEGDEWAVTLSAPFTGWTAAGPDGHQVYEGSLILYFAVPPEYRAYEDADWLDVYIDLMADGTWLVVMVNTGWDVIEFRRQSIYDDLGYEFFGDVDIPLDITQVDWAMLPRSFHQAMDLVDTSRWMMCAVRYAAIHEEPAEGSPIFLLCDARTPVIVLSSKEDWVQIQLPGRDETGWTRVGNLLPGDYQKIWYDRWYDEDSNAYGAKDIILDSSDPTVTWYTAAHDETTAAPFIVDHVEYVTQLGWCTDNCCCLLYSETLGTSGFVPMEQLPYILE